MRRSYSGSIRKVPEGATPRVHECHFCGHLGSEGFWHTETVGSIIVNSIVFSILKNLCETHLDVSKKLT